MKTSDNSPSNLFEIKYPVSNISTDNLVPIVEKASTIFERLSADFVPKNFEGEQDLINSRLEKWCQVSTNGNEQKFIKRLTWDEIDVNTIRAALGNVSLVGQDLPSWTHTLREAMEVASSIAQEIFIQSNTEQRQYIDVKTPLPFEEILIPFIEIASKKLIECAGSSYKLLSATAHAQLERSLLKRLSIIFALPLDLEFSLFRSARDSQLSRLIEQLHKNTSKQNYIEFVQNLLNNGLLSFFQEYSVVARLAATITDFWVEATAEFLQRLGSDWAQIQQSFYKDRELGQVIAVETSLSDPHNCGRSVCIVKFSSNLKLVYKPKNLGLEQVYFELIDWINQQGATLSLKVLKILNRSTYGWIEFVEALPCKNQQAVKNYYQRAGMLLCIAYILRGTDFHYENLIACGEQPVLIDLETLFHNNPQMQEEDNRAVSLAQRELRNSVAATALLPGAYIPLGQTQELVVDICGLGNIVEQQISISVLKWNYVNTDSMMMVVEKETKISSNTTINNQPFGEGIDTSLSHNSEELIVGFQQMYRFLMQRKDALFSLYHPLATFASQKVRLVLRNTNLYASIISNSLHYNCLRDGVERSIELDILSKSFIGSEDKDPLWTMLVAEKQALEQLDIPYISSYSNGNDIILNSEIKIEKIFKTSSYDSVVSRIQELSEKNLAGQISLIKSSFYSYLIDEHPDESTLQNSDMRLNTIAPLEKEAILQQAIAIAQELQQRAIRGSENDVAWIGIRYVPELQRFQLRPLSLSLYDGCCGISLFLAALANVTDKPEFSELALSSIHHLRKIVYEKDPQIQKTITENVGIGGARGLASVVYAFVRIADLLGETQLIEDAKHIASWMTIDKTTANQPPGLIHGTAGVILSLLALYNATKKRETLVQAITWGEHLLDTRVTTSAGEQLWTNSDGEPLIGFSEGIAGIAYALLQLYAVTKDSVFLSAAQEAIHYEQSKFSFKGDFLNSKKDTLSSINSWCYALPGIILARLGGLPILDTDEIHRELEIDLQQMLQSEFQVLDNLCCGNLSYVDALLVAAEHLSRPELLKIAHKQIAFVLQRSKKVGYFQLLPNLSPDIYNPCFCQGTAGIGYELLRFLYPQKLTSVLLWQ